MSEAVKGITKNSRLRSHYLKLAMMANIMRAFVVAYELDPSYKLKQEALLATLYTVESRKNRQWLTSDKISVQEAYNAFVEIMESVTEEQLLEVMQYVDKHKVKVSTLSLLRNNLYK